MMKLELWQAKIIAVMLVVGVLFLWHKYEVHVAVEETIVQQKFEYEKKVQELTRRSLNTEKELKKQISKVEDDKNAEIKNIDRKYRSTIDSLRQRNERSTASNSTGSTCDAESTKGATGAELYREDASFLVGFARDAEELKTHLNACYMQYDVVREQLNNYRK